MIACGRLLILKLEQLEYNQPQLTLMTLEPFLIACLNFSFVIIPLRDCLF